MSKYRAIVSIHFDDEDLQEFSENCGVEVSQLGLFDTINGELDNLSIGHGWVEQLFVNGNPTIGRVSGGVSVIVSEHEAT